MTPSRLLLSLSLSLLFTCLLLCPPCVPGAAVLAAGDNDWQPIDPAHLSMKEPMVEKGADAEALFWQVRVSDEAQDLVFTHHIRIKVFTERGRESQSKIDIPYLSFIKIRDVAGRTIKPDGQIVELKKEDVFERTIVKVSGLKLKAKSFAMPGVEPGAVIEYRWREVRAGMLANYVRLPYQREIPVQSVTYYIKPLSNPYFPYGMRAQFYRMSNTSFVKEKNGFHSLTMTNVPAFHEEARMPPQDQVRSWMLIYYSRDRKLTPDKFWKDYGREKHDEFKSRMKANDEVRTASAEITGDASTPEQKLERIYDYCRTRIKNASDDASGLTAVEREKLKENKNPSDTLKRGVGWGGDIDMLFAALVTAAGFDARIALAADRSDIFFDMDFADGYFLDPSSIAVRVGDGWRFFNPGFNYIPSGMLRWQEEGTHTLVTDPKEPTFVPVPISAPEKSMEKRTARLRLDEQGTLEGDVRIEYTGHAAVDMKEANDEDSPNAREEALRDRIRSRMSAAELSDIRIENVTDSVKPFVYAFHVRVPGYAQRTGKRLFLQPSFFRRGIGPLFSTSERRHSIYFHYPWSEQDDVEVELPTGFALESPEAPAKFGANELSQYNVSLSVTKDGRTLIYKRKFFFGGGGNILFPTTAYAPLKTYFDEVHKQDGHAVTLKQGVTSASVSTSPSN